MGQTRCRICHDGAWDAINFGRDQILIPNRVLRQRHLKCEVCAMIAAAVKPFMPLDKLSKYRSKEGVKIVAKNLDFEGVSRDYYLEIPATKNCEGQILEIFTTR